MAVSLGCPKNLVILNVFWLNYVLTGITAKLWKCDLMVNTWCEYYWYAVQESLEANYRDVEETDGDWPAAWGEEDQIRQVHPKVLVSGPHSYETVMAQVHKYVPKPEHNPYTKLCTKTRGEINTKTLCWFENLRRLWSSLYILYNPSLRGDFRKPLYHASIGWSKTSADAGVKELLVVSQDTSAYAMIHNAKKVAWNG